MSNKQFVKKNWFEILILLVIVVSIILYAYNPEIITFIGLIISLILIMINSMKGKQKTEPQKLVLNKIENILRDIHTFQQSGSTMKNHLNQKIYNLEKRYQKELKEIGCDIEEINEVLTITLNLGKKKLVAEPGTRIEIRWSDGHKFINNYIELEEELKEMK